VTAEFLPPTSRDVLPGRPAPFFLAAGEGERAHLFDQLFTVLLSGDETEGQFGVFTMEAPQGRAIPVHAHDDVHEIFFVLDGRVRVAIEEDARSTTASSPAATSATCPRASSTRSAWSRTAPARSG
jgi:quercetin 2,3-dioxygenase